MLHLSSTELSMIRASVRTRISAIENGLPDSCLSDKDKQELIERYERLLSALYDFSSTKTANSRTFLVEVLNTPVHFLGHEDKARS